MLICQYVICLSTSKCTDRLWEPFIRSQSPSMWHYSSLTLMWSSRSLPSSLIPWSIPRPHQYWDQKSPNHKLTISEIPPKSIKKTSDTKGWISVGHAARLLEGRQGFSPRIVGLLVVTQQQYHISLRTPKLGVPYTCDLSEKCGTFHLYLWSDSWRRVCCPGCSSRAKNLGEYVLCVFACYSTGSR